MSRSIAQSLEKLFSLAGKVVLLTGAAGGIGRVLVEGFASVGATMALCDLSAIELNHIAGGIKAKAGNARCYHLDLMEMGNIASHNSVGMLGGCSVYGASKSAVMALTRSMAVEWARHGIRANALALCHILTDLTTATWENSERSQYLRERIAML